MYIVKMRNPKSHRIETFETDCKNEEELHQALEVFEMGGYREITYSRKESGTK